MRASRRSTIALLLGCIVLSCCTWQDKLLRERFVREAVSTAEWRPATKADIRGSFEMTSVHGDAARAVLRISYYFEASGHFTGAALIVQNGGPEYQTIAGSWHLEDGKLDLSRDCEAAEATIAGDRLRLQTKLGTAILVRADQVVR